MFKNPYLPNTPVNRAVEAALPNGMGIPAGYASANKRIATPKVSQVENTIVVTAEEDTTIYYTTDGSTPTTESSVYTAPVELTGSATFKCIAVREGRTTSAAASVSFVEKVTCANPAISFDDNVATITCATTGATIHYTTDGSTPTEDSEVYSEAFEYASTIMVKAIAVKDGAYNSEVTALTCDFEGDAEIDILHAGETILFGKLASLTINEVEHSTDKVSSVRFTSRATIATTLDLPDTLWAGGVTPEIANAHIYQISYCNGVAVLTDLGGIA